MTSANKDSERPALSKSTRRCGCNSIPSTRTVSPATVSRVVAVVSAPDDHFSISPHCCVLPTGSRRVSGCSSNPTVCARIVSAASIFVTVRAKSAPDDHFGASPHCGMQYAGSGALVVLVATQLSVLGLYFPPVFLTEDHCCHFRPKQSFRCQSTPRCGHCAL